jgi:hypothetical protein
MGEEKSRTGSGEERERIYGRREE